MPDLKPLWDKAQTGIDKEFRVIRGKLVRVAKTKRGEEDRFPREIQSDLGTSFTSELTTTFFNKFGIKVTRSSVSHPQSNAVERVHRTIKRVIKALCVESGEDWEGVLPLALFSLRTVAHESTGFSPTELVMGKNLRTPQTLVYEEWMEEGNTSQSVVEYILQLNNRLKRCQDIAITRMKECQLKRKTWYDRDVVERKFVEGDLVMVLVTSKQNKLECCMKGNTRNRWRDGPVCPAADKELWRLGPDSSGQKRKDRKTRRERKEEKTGKRKERRDPEREKRKDREKTKSPRESEKTMNAGGVEHEYMN
ncbi:retrovirus-related Pol polyprotein from transposon 17.6 [Trichonephila clavipes]|nr:retrovirus-related Pol polyprotein from transposon 17.6 [Trichonephila clavipes]